MSIKFNDIEIPSFCIVKKIKDSILPPIAQNTVKINGRPGAVDFGNELGERKIEVEIGVVGLDDNGLKSKYRELAEWLYYDSPKELMILNEPDKYYMAKVTGESNFDEIISIGQGTIEFICTDPYAYSVNEKIWAFAPINESTVIFNNGGSAEAYPNVKLTFTEDTTHFDLVSADGFMSFGGAVDVTSQTAKDNNPLVLEDTMSSLSGWFTAVAVDGGHVSGSFISDGQKFSASDYGNAPVDWHGPALVKALPSSLPDFKVTAEVAFNSSAVDQIGRVELSLLDLNNSAIAKIAVSDPHENANHPMVEARLGERFTGEHIVKDYGSYRGVFRGWNKGILEIQRMGNSWNAYFCIIDSEGKHHTQLYKDWYDVNSDYMDLLSKIQIHIGSFGEHPPTALMNISNIEVYKPYLITAPNEVPQVFKAGEILEIDSATADIRLNGRPYFTSLDPASKFPVFKKGLNGLAVNPPIITGGQVKIRERWL